MSWAIEAVEKAAMARARQEVSGMPAMAFGLTMNQVLWLKMEYEKRTGAPVPVHENDMPRRPVNFPA